MKRLLIALDNNAGAQQIAEMGYQLSAALHAETYLLHVTSNTTFYASPNYSPVLGFDSFNTLDAVQTDTESDMQRSAEMYLENLKRHLGDERIKTVVKEGECAEKIVQTAHEINADIIVMGTHNRKGLDKVLLGSVAENVLHHSTIPLHIIPLKSLDKP